MFGLGPTELIIGLIIILLLFGAKRIPEIAGSFGKGIKEFKKNMNEVQREIEAPSSPPRADLPAGERVDARKDEAAEPKRLL